MYPLKCLLIILFLLSPTLTYANKIILYSERDAFGKVNQEKSWVIAYGEPAVANFYDLKLPLNFFTITPNATKEKVTLFRRELYDPWFNQPRIAYETKILPKEQGDYLICLEGENFLGKRGIGKFLVKTIFHVEKESTWDNLCGFELEIKPFTRPYGLRENSLFWGQVLLDGEPLENGTVTVERLRTKLNPKFLPYASTKEINLPLLQKTTRLDKRGYFWVNFEEEGWWLISLSFERGLKMYANQYYPYYLIAQLWIYIANLPPETKIYKSPPSKNKAKTKSTGTPSKP